MFNVLCPGKNKQANVYISNSDVCISLLNVAYMWRGVINKWRNNGSQLRINVGDIAVSTIRYHILCFRLTLGSKAKRHNIGRSHSLLHVAKEPATYKT